MKICERKKNNNTIIKEFKPELYQMWHWLVFMPVKYNERISRKWMPPTFDFASIIRCFSREIIQNETDVVHISA